MRRGWPRCAAPVASADAASRPASAISSSTTRARSSSEPVPATSRWDRSSATPRSRRAPEPMAIGIIDGTAVVKNSNGDTWIGDGHGRRAGERGQRQDHHRPGAGRGDREDRQRRRAPGQGRTWCRPRRERVRHDRGRDPRRRGGLAGPQHGVRQRTQRPARQPPVPPRTRRRSTCAPAPPTATSPSIAAIRTTPERTRHDQHDISTLRSRPPGCASPSATRSCSTASTWHVAEGTIFALLGPNGAGKTTAVQILSTLIGFDGGQVRVAGHDLTRDPDAVRAVIGVTGQFSAVDNLLTGEENLNLMADLRHLGRAEGQAADSRAARAVRSGGGEREAGIHVLGRHASSTRPRDDPGGRPAHHLPRRADHRSRPAQPPHDVADHPRPRGRWSHDLPHDPEPGRGGSARRTGSPCSTTGRLIAEGSPGELKRRIPGGHILLQFTDLAGLEAAADALGGSARDDEASPCRSRVGEMSDRSERCSTSSIARRSRSTASPLHTPNLDDVFLALTGHRGRTR